MTEKEIWECKLSHLAELAPEVTKYNKPGLFVTELS